MEEDRVSVYPQSKVAGLGHLTQARVRRSLYLDCAVVYCYCEMEQKPSYFVHSSFGCPVLFNCLRMIRPHTHQLHGGEVQGEQHCVAPTLTVRNHST